MLALTKWQSDYTVCVVPCSCEIKNHQLNKCQFFEILKWILLNCWISCEVHCLNFVGIHVRLNWKFPHLTSFNPSWFSEPLRIKRGVCEIRKRRYFHSCNFFVTLCMSVSHFCLLVKHSCLLVELTCHAVACQLNSDYCTHKWASQISFLGE
jgi:hypothetical protein